MPWQSRESLLWRMCTNCKKHFMDKVNWHSRAKLLASGSRWQNRKVLSSPPLIDTKTTTTYRTAVSKNDLKTSTTDFLIKDIKKTTLRWVGGAENSIQSGCSLPTPTPHVVTHNREGYHKLGAPPWRVTGLKPSLRHLHWEEEPHNVWLKTSITSGRIKAQ